MGSVGPNLAESAMRSPTAKHVADALGTAAFQTLLVEQLRVATDTCDDQLRSALLDMESAGVVLVRDHPMPSGHGPERVTSVSLVSRGEDLRDASARNEAHWQQFAQSYYLTHRCC